MEPGRLEFDRVAVILIAAGLALGVAGAWWAASVATASLGSDPDAGGDGHHGGPAPASGPGAEPALVAGLGVILAIVGLRRWLDKRLAYAGGVAVLAASSLLFADGIIHLYAIANHVSHLTYVVFFAASGVGLLVLGFLVLRERPAFVFLAILAVGALIAIYFASRLFALPLEAQPEPFEALGTVSKAIEFAALIPLYLMFMASATPASPGRSDAGARATSGTARRPSPGRPVTTRPNGGTSGSGPSGAGSKDSRRSGTVPERSK